MVTELGAPNVAVTPPAVAGEHGRPQMSMTVSPLDAAAYGFVEEEYFITGTARAFRDAGDWTSAGPWEVEPTGMSEPFKTRLLVRRPADPHAFNGTVLIEWNVISMGCDGAAMWNFCHKEILREGYAWVGVSAQYVGVEGAYTGRPGLKLWDPERYRTLEHPGDSFSYDIFGQAGLAVREQSEVVLGGLRPRELIATGGSQSGARLVTYLNAFHRLHGAFDGYLPWGRGANAEPIRQPPLPTAPRGGCPMPALIHDVGVPVLQVMGESEVFVQEPGNFLPARQPDGPRLRTWEIAGTAHYDATTSALTAPVVAADFPHYGGGHPTANPAVAWKTPNQVPLHYAITAALSQLRGWIRGGSEPPRAEPIACYWNSVMMREYIPMYGAVAIARDRYGMALGGVRLPHVEVPVALHSGEGNGPMPHVRTLGSSTPFDPVLLRRLYPTHEDYLERFTAAARRAVEQGFLLPADADEAIRLAADADVPGD